MPAPVPTVNTTPGASGAYIQPAEFGQDASGGFYVVRIHGTRAALQALVPGLALNQSLFNYRQSYSGANDQIEVRYAAPPGATEVPQPVWEIRYNPVEKDILRSSAAAGLSDSALKSLRAFMSDPTKWDSADPIAALTHPGLCECIKRGETSVLEFAPVLSKNLTFGTQADVTASQTNIRRIIPTSSMTTLEGFPTDLVFSLPNDTNPTPDARILKYGWMKEGPNVTRVAYQKTSIQQNWIYGLWPTVIYGDYATT